VAKLPVTLTAYIRRFPRGGGHTQLHVESHSTPIPHPPHFSFLHEGTPSCSRRRFVTFFIRSFSFLVPAPHAKTCIVDCHRFDQRISPPKKIPGFAVVICRGHDVPPSYTLSESFFPRLLPIHLYSIIRAFGLHPPAL
jgi:hypothetical protein